MDARATGVEVPGVHGDAARWPLVGRDLELVAIGQALTVARGAVISGDAGTGKTRLALEVVAATTRERELRWHVVTGSRGAASVPLGAWAHLLPESWEPGGDDQATWRRLAAGLEPSGGAIHLFVDDAQWLDPVSAGLLHHLVTTGQANAVVTVRRTEPTSQPLVALWKDGHLQRHDLEALDADQAADVLEAALAAPVEPRTARRMHERSAGNLLMLRELTDAGLADGSLRLRHGAWVQRGDGLRPGVRLTDLLGDRLAELDAADLAAAELVAVGEPLDGSLLAGSIDGSTLRRLADLRVVDLDVAGTRRVVRSAHPLLAEVLVDRMGALRRDEVIRQLVALHDAVEQPNDADLVRSAMWRLEVGLPVDGPDAVRASDLALDRSDFALAARLAEAAIAAGEGAPAAIRLGEARYRRGDSSGADDALAAIAAEVATLDPELQLRYGEARAIALGTDLGRLDDAIDVLEATLTTMPPGTARSALEARLAFLLSDCGRLRAAAPLADARMAAREDDEVAALLALRSSSPHPRGGTPSSS